MTNDVIQKLLKSKTLKNKEVLKSVLLYMFESESKKKRITEQSIALDVFKRKDFDGTDDTIVRVNVFKLRQALEKYYLEEGKTDTIKVEIPKGSYSLKFRENSDGILLKTVKNNSKLVFIQSSVLTSSLILGLALFYVFNNKQSVIWDSFNNKLPTKVILCQPHFQKYEHKLDSRVLVVREMGINSAKDDSITQSIFPSDQFNHPDLEFSYFMPTNVYPLPHIFKGLNQSDVKDIDIFSLQEYSSKELNNTNTVFVGSFKSMGYTADLLDRTSIKIRENPLQIILHDSINLIPENLPQDKFTDYALAVKYKGESDNYIMLFSSLYSTGITSIVKKLNDKRFLTELEKINKIPEQFELILKVEGVNYSSLNFEIVHFNKL